MVVLLIVAAWYGVGLWSFVHWERYSRDLTLGALLLAILFFAWVGPFMYLMGWDMETPSEDRPTSVVVMKQREPKDRR